jgi:signal transduction histidine kinase
MLPIIRNVHFEQTEDRLKVVYPTQRKPVWLLVYSLLLVIWVVGLIWGIVFVLRDVAFSGERFAIVFTIMLLIWLYIWYRLGRIVWQQWQYYAARREILFLEKDRLIIRRPVSLLGITDAYDMDYVSPFYFSEEELCPGFQYGSRRIYFARGLDRESAKRLVSTLNDRQFGHDAFEDSDDY